MPLEVAWAITVTWHGGDFLCRIMAFFRIVGLYLSSFVLVCLAVDRYLAVAHPMHSLGSGKRGKIMITCAWTLSILCSLPQVYIFHVESHPEFPWYKQCVTFGSLPESYDLAYRIFCMLMMYALPFAIILLLYVGIVIELYRRTRESSQSNFSEGLRRSGLGNLGRAREKTLKMTVAIVAVFFVCWTPYYVMCLWYMIDANSAKFVDQRIQRALFLFACTNSTANPVVYGIFHLKSTFATTFSFNPFQSLLPLTASKSFTCPEVRHSNHSNSSLRRTNTINTPPKFHVGNGHDGSIQTYPRPAIITTSKSLRRSKSASVKFTHKSHNSTKRLVSWNPHDASFC
ncbi:unnamed protein product [Allacma fusca]|uniref:G-protein coupled receptors family 1 profile domain-containing protein n=1 Tax=Allacma fusca TaxID=39272 RepID=A0A8J2NYV9_9HEXA|nr:unnamed protein product [Allacma fusca]